MSIRNRCENKSINKFYTSALFEKLLRVFMSVETIEQFETACRFANLVFKREKINYSGGIEYRIAEILKARNPDFDDYEFKRTFSSTIWLI